MYDVILRLREAREREARNCSVLKIESKEKRCRRERKEEERQNDGAKARVAACSIRNKAKVRDAFSKGMGYMGTEGEQRDSANKKWEGGGTKDLWERYKKCWSRGRRGGGIGRN